jgi:hypothetical protein
MNTRGVRWGKPPFTAVTGPDFRLSSGRRVPRSRASTRLFLLLRRICCRVCRVLCLGNGGFAADFDCQQQLERLAMHRTYLFSDLGTAPMRERRRAISVLPPHRRNWIGAYVFLQRRLPVKHKRCADR